MSSRVLSLSEFYYMYVYKTYGSYCRFWYIDEICRYLEKCVTGEVKNLLINIPPRCFKTTIVSRVFPAWYMSILPECESILTSATSGLAVDNCSAVRRILAEDWVRRLPYNTCKIDPNKDTQGYFRTTKNGSVYAAGLGGTITGFGAGKARDKFGGCIIIDDPLKAADARSSTMLKNCVDYYTGVLKSRRNNVESTPMIVIMQRLSSEDLSGWLLKNESNKWTHLVLPAIDTQGNVLNSMTLSKEELDLLKVTDPYTYYAQYQQEPTVINGNIIHEDWWRYYKDKPRMDIGYTFITADTAFKSRESADESVLQVWHADMSGLYLIDALYGRWEFPMLLQNMKEIYGIYANYVRDIYVEDRASGTSLIQSMQQSGLPCTAWLPKDYGMISGSKLERVIDSTAIIYRGDVKLPQGEEFTRVLVEQSAQFSRDMTHKHDDHVDAMTMAVSIYKDMLGISC